MEREGGLLPSLYPQRENVLYYQLCQGQKMETTLSLPLLGFLSLSIFSLFLIFFLFICKMCNSLCAFLIIFFINSFVFHTEMCKKWSSNLIKRHKGCYYNPLALQSHEYFLLAIETKTIQTTVFYDQLYLRTVLQKKAAAIES